MGAKATYTFARSARGDCVELMLLGQSIDRVSLWRSAEAGRVLVLLVVVMGLGLALVMQLALRGSAGWAVSQLAWVLVFALLLVGGVWLWGVLVCRKHMASSIRLRVTPEMIEREERWGMYRRRGRMIRSRAARVVVMLADEQDVGADFGRRESLKARALLWANDGNWIELAYGGPVPDVMAFAQALVGELGGDVRLEDWTDPAQMQPVGPLPGEDMYGGIWRMVESGGVYEVSKSPIKRTWLAVVLKRPILWVGFVAPAVLVGALMVTVGETRPDLMRLLVVLESGLAVCIVVYGMMVISMLKDRTRFVIHPFAIEAHIKPEGSPAAMSFDREEIAWADVVLCLDARGMLVQGVELGLRTGERTWVFYGPTLAVVRIAGMLRTALNVPGRPAGEPAVRKPEEVRFGSSNREGKPRVEKLGGNQWFLGLFGALLAVGALWNIRHGSHSISIGTGFLTVAVLAVAGGLIMYWLRGRRP